MKFSYSWIRAMVDGLDVPAESLERLITMRTAECEGIETAGELLAGAVPARVEAVEQIEGGKHVVKAIVDAGKYGRQNGGLWRAELPRRHHNSLRSARLEIDSRRSERRHARQRFRTRHQPRSRRHHRTRPVRRTPAPRPRHRYRQQEHHASPGSLGSPRHGARSRGHHRKNPPRPGQS